jgi:DNA-binding transcriptional MerR regulator
MVMALKQFAQRLAVVSLEEPATLARQLRFWTEIGVIPIANDVAVGTGRARFYTEESLLAAAVAIELAGWGFPVGRLKKVIAFLVNELRDEKSGLKEVAAGEDDRHLLLFREPGPTGSREEIAGWLVHDDNLSDLVKVRGFTAPGSSVFMLDLQHLWAKLQSLRTSDAPSAGR